MRKRGNYARAQGGKHTCNTAAARACLIETCDLEKVIREPMIVIRASSQFERGVAGSCESSLDTF